MDVERIIEMTILEEVEVGLGIDSIQVSLAEMIEAVVVGLDHIKELVLIETDLDALSVRNMNILLKIVQICKHKKNQNKYNKCIMWMKIKQH